MVERLSVPVVEPVADINIVMHYALEEAAWIWHPEVSEGESAFLQFVNRFDVDAASSVVFHVSGDQRYSLYLDDELVSRGPDRSDPMHWSFASYRVDLGAGTHVLRAELHWIGDQSPVAQMSVRGGFILKAEELGELLDTGTGNWQVARRDGLSMGPALEGAYHVVGPSYTFDGASWHAPLRHVPAVVVDRFEGSGTGIIHPGWALHPSPLPEQLSVVVCPGVIRAVDGGESILVDGELASELGEWNALLAGEPLTIPAKTCRQVIWDLEDYYCGYSRLRLSGGAGARVSWEWAESLFDGDDTPPLRHKGNRDEVVGKQWDGFGDVVVHGGGDGQLYSPPWWRSGRYVRLCVETGDTPLTIDGVSLDETGYPITVTSQFKAAPGGLESIIPLAVRGIRMCAHETFMDCPYYEQLMYVGDTRLQALTLFTMTADDRLPKRAIELYDWSRWRTGFVAERYPSEPYQLSLTFSLLWISMVHDYSLWRDDLDWVRERLVGVRCLLEHFRLLAERENGMLNGIPGWSFMDWVPGWGTGISPDGQKGLSAPINLLYLQALRQTAEMEDAVGEPELAARCRRLAGELGEGIVEVFWDEERGLLADNASHSCYSEHSQCLALLNEVLGEGQRERSWQGLQSSDDLARCTVYFSYYLLETYRLFGRGDLLLKKLDFWKALVAQGFKTPVESPEPSRSDCHAWGSHPLFHYHATLAGIRPAAPGFQAVRIAPAMGDLTRISSTLPHPQGEIVVQLERGDVLQATVTLPAGIPGSLDWAGKSYPLEPGTTTKLSL